jgi:UDP-N-acetylmuramoylalanine--D-glutamate ligase
MNFSVHGRNVTVVGAARSGVSAALLLAERGARVTLSEMRSDIDPLAAGRLRSADVNVELGEHRLQTFTAADLIVVSPGVPLDLTPIVAARDAGISIIGEIELASRFLTGRLVAITGTKGKSTTTTLTGHMFSAGGLKALVGGNIGTPLSAQVAQSTPDTFHIVEVSSFQLETTETFHPWIAVLLNLSSDHLDRHASMEEYGAAKARIFANQTDSDWAVVNADDPQTLLLARAIRARKLQFSLEGRIPEGIVTQSGVICDVREGSVTPLVPLSSIRLLGRHLFTDVMAATTVARIAGVSRQAMVHAVESFSGLEHALEPVALIDGVRFVNDSKATNVEAAHRAVESFERGLVVIMGGRYKSGDFRVLREPLRSREASVVAIGEATPLIEEALEGAAAVYRSETMSAAVRRAFELAGHDGTVLLAPACASFDMFRDYVERGQAFKAEVMKLAMEAKQSKELRD